MNDPLAIWVGAIATLIVFSYLAGDNPLYRFVQQAALGTSVGFGIVIAWQQVLEPMWWAPIRGVLWETQDLPGALGRLAFASGSQVVQANAMGPSVAWQQMIEPMCWMPAREALLPKEHWTGALWLLALVPGSLWYFQLSKKWFWVSTIVFGLFAGVAAGFTFKGVPLLVLPQIGGCLKPLNPFAGPEGFTWQALWESLNNLLFLVGLATALLYFFFSVRMENRLLGASIRIGRLMIMVALGAMFGNTVMTRMAYLIERMQFLYESWLAPMLHLGAS
jgi:hypothetical protein